MLLRERATMIGERCCFSLVSRSRGNALGGGLSNLWRFITFRNPSARTVYIAFAWNRHLQFEGGECKRQMRTTSCLVISYWVFYFWCFRDQMYQTVRINWLNRVWWLTFYTVFQDSWISQLEFAACYLFWWKIVLPNAFLYNNKACYSHPTRRLKENMYTKIFANFHLRQVEISL